MESALLSLGKFGEVTSNCANIFETAHVTNKMERIYFCMIQALVVEKPGEKKLPHVIA
jgi:hypothetical protein